MDFEEDIRQYVLANLPHDPSQTQELASMDWRRLLIVFWNWLSRFVPPQPRRVHRSRALDSNPLAKDPAYQPALEEIIAKIEAGENITRYLTDRVKKHPYQGSQGTGRKRTPLSKRRDLDLMLNDWGVHHLHLSTQLEAAGFVTRTEPLLFTAFRPQDAYLIDIMHHGDWTREHVLEVIIREWPSAGLIHEAKGVICLSHHTPEGERGKLRNSAINAPFELDGKVYAPTGGLTEAGTSIHVTMAVNRLVHHIRTFRKTLEKDPDYVAKALASRGLTPPAKPDLHFVFLENGGYGIMETHTHGLFQLR